MSTKEMRRLLDAGVIRASATRANLEKTDRLLGWPGRVVVLRPGEQPEGQMTNAPAWTNGKTITINGRQMPLWDAFRKGFDSKTLMLTMGLNYHELAHCFFTPRLNSDYVVWVISQGMFMSLNALEDQQAESKFVRMYTPARHYFTSIVANLMLEANDDQQRQAMLESNYPLICGRKFLPADIRRAFRQHFVAPNLIPDFERIVDEYCDCVYPLDKKRMMELVEEYHNLTHQALGQDPMPCTFHSSHESHDQSDGTDPASGLSQGEMLDTDEVRRVVVIKPVGEDISKEPIDPPKQKKLEKGSSQSNKRSDDKSDKEDGSEDGNGADQQKRAETPSKTPKGSGGSDPSSESADEEGGEPSTKDGAPGGRGAGQHQGRSTKFEPLDLDEMLRDAIEDSREEVQDELTQREEAIKNTEERYQVDSTPSPFKERPLEGMHTTAARQVEKALRRLNQKFKPGWHIKQESGKVNVNQLARIKRGETDVFKRFQQGVNNALNFEVVILLDQSGSMFHLVKESSDALWVLHKAMKGVKAETTVLGYSDSDECKVLMQRGKETPHTVHDYWTGGSTYVMPALEETSRIFKVSRKPLKLVVIVTDGQFSDAPSVADWLRHSPNPVAIVGIGSNVAQTWDPNAYRSLKVSKTIGTPMDLVPLVQELVMRLATEKYSAVR